MKTYDVDVSRRFVQTETAILTVVAKSATEARKIAKELAQTHEDWETGDGEYDHYTVEDVSEVKP